jgi:polyhydroxyalkanoate synthesis regulator phasin
MKTQTLKSVPLPAAVATTFDEALKSAAEKVEGLSADAKTAAARLEKQVRTTASRLNADVGRAKKDAARYAEDLTKKVTGTAETLIATALHKFNVPTRRELKDLTAKVDVLGRKIDGLTAARRAHGPMKRTRRAA